LFLLNCLSKQNVELVDIHKTNFKNNTELSKAMTQNQEMYVIGHKSPDTDTVASAICAAAYLNARDNTTKFVPAITAPVNTETEYILKTFNITTPQILSDATGKQIFLVDHNEQSQMVNGADKAQIIGFIDHHKINFTSDNPLEIIVRPWGCTCTILHDLFIRENLSMTREVKALMLCALLSDTMMLKSPTTTPKDAEVLKQLASELDLDYVKLGLELLKAKSQVSAKTPQQIIDNDFKDFDVKGKKVGIGQIETPDITELDEKLGDIVSQMNIMKENMSVSENPYHSIILMVTDVMLEGSRLLVVSDDEQKIAKLFNTHIHNNISDFIPGMLSRKKQVAPIVSEKL
jgi:manganese-dependent inorganic pyrophosphatase